MLSARRAVFKALRSRQFSKPPNESFYVTTPIFYVNGDPHLGHAYSLVVADTLARFHRRNGRIVHFLTGTDEYGQKVDQSAKALAWSPIDFATEKSNRFRALTELLGCSHDDFIRTTEERHHQTVSKVWQALEKKGELYEGVYEGWYSVRDETFYTEEELIEGRAPTGAEVVWLAENVYFFRLSSWRTRLHDYYSSNTSSIFPEHRKSEILRALEDKDKFKDVCVSRRNVTWGIPVPFNKDSQVIYVWLDALVNYLSALGYDPAQGMDAEMMKSLWPASVHVVGKDILRFHALLWPAILLALDLPLPKTVVAHGWWTKDGVKMSKSVGNVVDPFRLIADYGSDAFRFFLLSEVPLGSDGDFNFDNFIKRINTHLSDNLGNLTQRVLTMVSKHCEGGMVPSPALPLLVQDEELLRDCVKALQDCEVHIDQLQLHRMVETIFRVPRLCNKYMDTEAPWKLRKTDPKRMETVLYVLMESLRRIAILLDPLLPHTSSSILNLLQVPSYQRTLNSFEDLLVAGIAIPPPVPLFPKRSLPLVVEDENQKSQKTSLSR
jgi:methionyl-tRNA synthetase